MKVPDIVEPLVGYRFFTQLDGRLMSPYRVGHWHPAPKYTTAVCLARYPLTVTHTSPDFNCRCGLYARGTYDRVVWTGLQDGYVVARVEAWGVVVIGESGFRAQYMRLTGIVLDDYLSDVLLHHEQRVKSFAEAYNVPVVSVEEASRSRVGIGGELHEYRARDMRAVRQISSRYSQKINDIGRSYHYPVGRAVDVVGSQSGRGFFNWWG